MYPYSRKVRFRRSCQKVSAYIEPVSMILSQRNVPGYGTNSIERASRRPPGRERLVDPHPQPTYSTSNLRAPTQTRRRDLTVRRMCSIISTQNYSACPPFRRLSPCRTADKVTPQMKLHLPKSTGVERLNLPAVRAQRRAASLALRTPQQR